MREHDDKCEAIEWSDICHCGCRARRAAVVEAARATLKTADNFLSDFDGGGQRREALNDTLDALEKVLAALDLPPT